jgi:hypothetical protein
MKKQGVNTFTNGLSMDTNEMNTDKRFLTDAVNASLVQMNDNEYILQTEEGNSEAFELSEGFTPVVSKNYRNITYIFSHNHITGESEIGTFPSYLNISKEELTVNNDEASTNGTFESLVTYFIYYPSILNLLSVTLNGNPVSFITNSSGIQFEVETTITGTLLLTFDAPIDVNQPPYIVSYNGQTDKSQPMRYAPLPNYRQEFSIYPNPVDILNTNFLILRTDLFNYQMTSVMEMELQQAFDGSTNIILTDNVNQPRIINSGFIDIGTRWIPANRKGLKDTNFYNDENFITATNLILRSTITPTLFFNGLSNNGELPKGDYIFYFKYINQDGNETDIIEQSSLVSVFDGDTIFEIGQKAQLEITSKKVEFILQNIDNSFNGVKVYYQYSYNATKTFNEIIQPYLYLDATQLTISITGREQKRIVDSTIALLEQSNISTIKTITQVQNRLFGANIKYATYPSDKFELLCRTITIGETTIPQIADAQRWDYSHIFNSFNSFDSNGGYYNYLKSYNSLGYFRGETYAFGIVFYLNDGTKTDVFPVRGIDNYNGNAAYSSFAFSNDIRVNTTNNNENINGIYRFANAKTNPIVFTVPLTEQKSDVVLAGETYKQHEVWVNTTGTQKIQYTNATSIRPVFPKFIIPESTLLELQSLGVIDYVLVRADRQPNLIMQGYMTPTLSILATNQNENIPNGLAPNIYKARYEEESPSSQTHPSNIFFYTHWWNYNNDGSVWNASKWDLPRYSYVNYPYPNISLTPDGTMNTPKLFDFPGLYQGNAWNYLGNGIIAATSTYEGVLIPQGSSISNIEDKILQLPENNIAYIPIPLGIIWSHFGRFGVSPANALRASGGMMPLCVPKSFFAGSQVLQYETSPSFSWTGLVDANDVDFSRTAIPLNKFAFYSIDGIFKSSEINNLITISLQPVIKYMGHVMGDFNGVSLPRDYNSSPNELQWETTNLLARLNNETTPGNGYYPTSFDVGFDIFFQDSGTTRRFRAAFSQFLTHFTTVETLQMVAKDGYDALLDKTISVDPVLEFNTGLTPNRFISATGTYNLGGFGMRLSDNYGRKRDLGEFPGWLDPRIDYMLCDKNNFNAYYGITYTEHIECFDRYIPLDGTLTDAEFTYYNLPIFDNPGSTGLPPNTFNSVTRGILQLPVNNSPIPNQWFKIITEKYPRIANTEVIKDIILWSANGFFPSGLSLLYSPFSDAYQAPGGNTFNPSLVSLHDYNTTTYEDLAKFAFLGFEQNNFNPNDLFTQLKLVAENFTTMSMIQYRNSGRMINWYHPQSVFFDTKYPNITWSSPWDSDNSNYFKANRHSLKTARDNNQLDMWDREKYLAYLMNVYRRDPDLININDEYNIEAVSYQNITNRTTIEFSLDNLTGSNFETFGKRGDCYIASMYYQINKYAVDSNNPPSDAPRFGTVINLYQESTVNPALRAQNVTLPVEASLFGSPRSFVPVTSSTINYNFGTSDTVNNPTGYLSRMLNYGNSRFNTPESTVNTQGDQSALRRKFLFPIFSIFTRNRFPTRVIYSNVDATDEFINAYRVFQGLNFKDYVLSYGEITKIETFNNSIVIVFEHGVGIIPIQERRLLSQDASTQLLLGEGDILPPYPAMYSEDFGSKWQTSILKTPNSIYGVDIDRSKIWRLRGKGLEILSDFNVQSFIRVHFNTLQNKMFDLTPNQQSFVKTFFDLKRHTVYFVRKDDSVVEENNPLLLQDRYTPKKGVNIAYNEILSKWLSRYTWIPQDVFNILDNMYSIDSFDEDDVCVGYVHQKQDNTLNHYVSFYNKKEPFEFEFIVNEDLFFHKVFDNLKIISNNSLPLYVEFQNENGELIQEVYDMDKYGLIKGNTRYKENHVYLTIKELWKKQQYLTRFKFSGSRSNNSIKLSETRLRDKYVKIRLRYSGEKRTFISAVMTLFRISYS